jgi:hypothetical protein
MEDVDHTNPHTDESFGQTQTFRRGTVVAADGGRDDQSRPDGGTADDDPEEDDETMEDVEHESPSEGANRTFERGTEGRTDTV